VENPQQDWDDNTRNANHLDW